LELLFVNNDPPRVTANLSSSSISTTVPRVKPLSLIDLEDISEDSEDDEILLSSLSNHHRTVELVDPSQKIEDYLEVNVNDEIVTPVPIDQATSSDTQQQKQRKACRSKEARNRRNRKRNRQLRPDRDRHVIYRQVYHRFNLKQLREFVADLNIRHAHVKPTRSSDMVSIGWKKSELVDRYFDQLPGDIFDKEHYYNYRRKKHR